MLKLILPLIIILLLQSCAEETTENSIEPKEAVEGSVDDVILDTFLLEQGQWLGRLNISDERNIPFNFEVIKDSVFIINSEERIGALVQSEDGLYSIKMPIFDSEFRFSITEKGLFGFWHNYARGDYKVDFKANKINDNFDNRFSVVSREKNGYVDGKWETTFSEGKEEEYKALGIFNQNGQNVTGTFVTKTGDYRYLQGNVIGDSIYLSCFDGSHAFLFEGKITDNEIDGLFYSGTHWQEPWKATLNSTFELDDPYSLTEIVDGEKLEFTFPNLEGEEISYPDPKYTGKVVIIQILGSWCPNCMDETKFLTELHKTYKNRGLEIIGLSFEVPEGLQDKIERVKGLKAHFGAEYEFLVAGNASKKEAEEAIPALSNVLSFPTTIFIDKDGVIRKVHTGFYGPGTGSYYLEYVSEIQTFVQSLLNE